jgi:hypothetical protein
MIVSPDCRAAKHGACSGDAWDDAADKVVPCECRCTCERCGGHGAEPHIDPASTKTVYIGMHGHWGYMLHPGACANAHADAAEADL